MTCCLQWIIKVIGSYHLLISSQLRHVQCYWHVQETPCEASNAEFTSFINFSWGFPKLLAKDNQVVFSQLNLRIDPLIAWIYPSQKRAWLDCLSPIVAGWMLLLFRKHPRVLGWHAQVKTTKLGSYHLNRGWIEPRTKTKQKPYFTWNTQLFYWGGSLFHSFMT